MRASGTVGREPADSAFVVDAPAGRARSDRRFRARNAGSPFTALATGRLGMGDTPSERHRTDTNHYPAFDRSVDWAIGAILGVVGVLVALAGAALYRGVDRPAVAELVRTSEFRSDVLTEAEAVDALLALAEWGGIGIAVAGGVLVVVGGAVVVTHGRARRDGRPTPGWILGVVGAMVGAILSFIPLSPAIGGAAAGYLDTNRARSGLGPGAAAGLFATLPVLVIAVFAGVGLLVGVPAEVAVPVVTAVGVAVILVLVYFVGLSAVGGYVGGWLGDR